MDDVCFDFAASGLRITSFIPAYCNISRRSLVGEDAFGAGRVVVSE